MIINVSGRCDIPAFYPKWFINRLEEGYVDVRNPFNKEFISRVELNKDTVDLIVFCTKNPIPIFQYLDKIPYPYLMQVTITPYRKEIEPNVFSKRQIIQCVKEISKKIGKERVYVRYDPIFLSNQYNLDYHVKMFEKLCKELSLYTSRIIISFLDLKKNTIKHHKEIKQVPFTKENIELIAKAFSDIASKYHLEISTCCEDIDFSKYGFVSKPCIDRGEVEKILGRKLELKESKTRKNCHCLESIDIGDYNCCPHFCKYCYANYQEEDVMKRRNMHSDTSSVLVGKVADTDKIKARNI